MTRGSPNGGYVLVAVLSVMLLLTGLTAAGSLLIRSALHSARLGDEDTAATGLTRAGLEITAYELFVLKLPPAAVDGRRVRVTGATLTPSVIDEAGKVDINGADPRLLQSLFTSVGMEAGAATALVAQFVTLRGDPPAQDPSVGAPAQPPRKQRGFGAVEDLASVPGLTRADLRRLMPLLTVFNPDGKVDILTASEQVLRAVPGLTPPKIADILAHRQNADKETAANLQSMLGDAATFAKIEPGPAYTVRIQAATTSGRRRSLEAVVAASKSPNDPFYILDWRE